jgi:hypothetical protein
VTGVVPTATVAVSVTVAPTVTVVTELPPEVIESAVVVVEIGHALLGSPQASRRMARNPRSEDDELRRR